MYNPVSTIRIQFNKDFTFGDFEKAIPFLVRTGIGTIYASPIFAATAGSMHGYDVINPLAINPEIGTRSQLEKISSTLKKHSIGWIQDIVPNHMAFHPSNPWILDVLEKGPMSVYHDFFDVSWSGDYYQARLMAPFLEMPLDKIALGEDLQAQYTDGVLVFDYKGTDIPLSSRSYEFVLTSARHPVPESIQSILNELRLLHQIEDRVQYNLRWNELLIQLRSVFKSQPCYDYLTAAIDEVNNDRDKIEKLTGLQFYRLCDWRETSTRINYRRFFTVNSLIGLNMHNEKVFTLYHQLIAELCEQGIFDGVRVDHIDGLTNPRRYLRQLRDLIGSEKYIVVEKILEPGEELDTRFPVQGTTGYDFLGVLNNLFAWRPADQELDAFYKSLTRRDLAFDERVREKKQLILDSALQGELSNLVERFPQPAAVAPETIKKVIAAFLVNCPWYRLYGDKFPLKESEQGQVRQILDRCRSLHPDLEQGIKAFESAVLNKSKEQSEKKLLFYQRLMQLSGPLMAKGVEDTLMYTYNRFIGHNEVGDSPGEFGLSIGQFHSIMKKRQRDSNLSMSATATHDTKRGEDTRMRLSAISDLSTEWIKSIQEYMDADGSTLDKNIQYHLFQSIVGSYVADNDQSYQTRLEDYVRKALREGKRHSNWDDPNEDLEERVMGIARDLVTPGSKFLKHIGSLLQSIIEHGMVNSLVQVVLKATCPGVPDFYQGSLLWDFSFVDPDNRRPVDFVELNRRLEKSESSLQNPWLNKDYDNIKLKLTARLTMFRRDNRELFKVGNYIPLRVTGAHSAHVIAFARIHQGHCVVTACMLHTARLISNMKDLGKVEWNDTRIQLPEFIESEFTDILSGAKGQSRGALHPKDIFKDLPMAVLDFKKRVSQRAAGILIHVTSLPSTSASGDLGPSARAFADFLFEDNQKRWQWLPVNAIDPEASFSPYSSLSSMAGNPLLISHEDLVEDGLLSARDIGTLRSGKSNIDYNAAFERKNEWLTKAWENFRNTRPLDLFVRFEQFKRDNSIWLDGYAAFELLSNDRKQPWFKWPMPYRTREKDALNDFLTSRSDDVEKVKWIQFIFHRQIIALKSYCNERGIKLIGDLPFYVSHCSADAWQHRELFQLDIDGNLIESAGVPPDYFSEDGQSWNMPTYNWDTLSADGYQWWVRRIRQTLKLFDVVRLDHFRAFVSYWSIPQGKSAKEGRWLTGPGAKLFDHLKKEIGELPIIAEDLGDLGQPEIDLRDQFSLPGMKVLQFGFGGDFPQSIHLPHHHERNFIAYTGTHDNNTTRGWFEDEVSETEKKNLTLMLGKSPSRQTISSELIRVDYASVADTVVIPIQDILNLGSTARLNKPGTASDNWRWRMRKLPSDKVARMLRTLVWTYNR